MKMLSFTGPTKTYKQAKMAEQVAERLLVSVDPELVEHHITVIIAADDTGRFAPVFFLRSAAHHLAASIAAKGYHAIG